MRTRLTLALALLTLACGSPEAAAPPTTVTEAPPPPPPEPPPPPTRPGPLCTYHGVCWARPFPQGNALHAVRALSPTRVLMVGDRGTVLAYDGAAFALEDTPTRERLLDVADAPTGELFAVGEHGTILRRDAEPRWSAMTSGTDVTLRAVIALAANDVLAVGDGPTALHFDGTTWSPETLPADLPAASDLLSIARRESGVVVLARHVTDGLGAVDERFVLSRDASGWQVLGTSPGDAGGIVALADGTLMVSGSTERHGDGTTWSARSFGSDRPLDAIARGTAADGADVVWAAGFDGRFARFDGRAWHDETITTAVDVHDLDVQGPDVWAVGEHGLIARHGEGGWSVIGGGADERLEGVHGLSRTDVWAVGEHVMLHWDGAAWTRDGGLDPGELEALAGVRDVLFAVGTDGAIRRFADGTWVNEPSGTSTKLEGVWTLDGEHAIAVGGSEWTQRTDGAWHAVADRPAATGLWGSAENDVWAAGGGGLEHFDGTTWSPVAGTESSALFAVWGAAADDVWAVGAEGRILHWDGHAWSPSDADTSQDLVGVWGRSATDVWAVGQHGTIVHWDGERWRWRDSGTDELLHAVWGAEGGETWIVGHGAVVLRIDP